MKSNSSILVLIKENIALFDSVLHAYLFGSVIDPNIAHNDIDILIVYEEYSDKIEDTLQKIALVLGEVSNLPVDLTALSVEEEKDVAFLEKIKPYYLKIK